MNKDDNYFSVNNGKVCFDKKTLSMEDIDVPFLNKKEEPKKIEDINTSFFRKWDDFIDSNNVVLPYPKKNKTIYGNIVDKSLSSSRNKPVRVSKKRKKVKKSKFKKMIYTVLVVSIMINGYFIYNHKQSKVYDVINTSLILDTVDYTKLDDKKLEEQLEIVYNKMHEKGFSNDVIMYYTRKVFGEKAFDIMANVLGFKSGDNFVINQGYKHDVQRNATGTMEWAEPSHFEFNLDMDKKIVEETNEIIKKGR